MFTLINILSLFVVEIKLNIQIGFLFYLIRMYVFLFVGVMRMHLSSYSYNPRLKKNETIHK